MRDIFGNQLAVLSSQWLVHPPRASAPSAVEDRLSVPPLRRWCINKANPVRGRVSGISDLTLAGNALRRHYEQGFYAKRTQFRPTRMCPKCFMTKGLGMVQYGTGLKNKANKMAVGSRLKNDCRNEPNLLGPDPCGWDEPRRQERLAASLRIGLLRQTNPIIRPRRASWCSRRVACPVGGGSRAASGGGWR